MIIFTYDRGAAVVRETDYFRWFATVRMLNILSLAINRYLSVVQDGARI